MYGYFVHLLWYEEMLGQINYQFLEMKVPGISSQSLLSSVLKIPYPDQANKADRQWCAGLRCPRSLHNAC